MQEHFPPYQGLASLSPTRLNELTEVLERNIDNLKCGSTPETKCALDLSSEMPSVDTNIPQDFSGFYTSNMEYFLHHHLHFRTRVLYLAGLPATHLRSPQEVLNSKEIVDAVSDLLYSRKHLHPLSSSPNVMQNALARSYLCHLARFLLSHGNPEALVEYMKNKADEILADLKNKSDRDLEKIDVIDDSTLRSFQDAFLFDWRHYHHCHCLLIFYIMDGKVHSETNQHLRDFKPVSDLLLLLCASWGLLHIAHMQHKGNNPWSATQEMVPLWITYQMQLVVKAVLEPHLCLQQLNNAVNLLVEKLVRLKTLCPSYFADFGLFPGKSKRVPVAEPQVSTRESRDVTGSSVRPVGRYAPPQQTPHPVAPSSVVPQQQSMPLQIPPQTNTMAQQQTQNMPANRQQPTSQSFPLQHFQPANTKGQQTLQNAMPRHSQPASQSNTHRHRQANSSQSGTTAFRRQSAPPHQSQTNTPMVQQQQRAVYADHHMQAPWGVGQNLHPGLQQQQQQHPQSCIQAPPNAQMSMHNSYMQQYPHISGPPMQQQQQKQQSIRQMQQMQQMQQQQAYRSNAQPPRVHLSNGNHLYNLDQVTKNLGSLIEPYMPPPAYRQIAPRPPASSAWPSNHMPLSQSAPTLTARLQQPAPNAQQPRDSRSSQRHPSQSWVKPPQRRVADYLDRPPMTPLNQSAPDETIAPIVIQPLGPPSSGVNTRRDSYSPRSESFMQHRSHFNVSVNSTSSRVSNSPISDAEDVKPNLSVQRKRINDLGPIDLDPETVISSLGLTAESNQKEDRSAANVDLISHLKNLVNPGNSNDRDKLQEILSHLKGTSRRSSDQSASMSSEKNTSGEEPQERRESTSLVRPSLQDAPPPVPPPPPPPPATDGSPPTSPALSTPPPPTCSPNPCVNKTPPRAEKERISQKHPSQSSEEGTPSAKDEPPEKRKSPGAFSNIGPATYIKDEDGFVTMNRTPLSECCRKQEPLASQTSVFDTDSMTTSPAVWQTPSSNQVPTSSAPEYIFMEDNFDISDKSPTKPAATSPLEGGDDGNCEDLILTGHERAPEGITVLRDDDIEFEAIRKKHIYIDLDTENWDSASDLDVEVEDHLPDLSPCKAKDIVISRRESVEFKKHYSEIGKDDDAVKSPDIPNSDDTVGSSNDVQILQDLYNKEDADQSSDPICIDSE